MELSSILIPLPLPPICMHLHPNLTDGLGYHDDGEEHCHEDDDDDGAQFAKKKSKKSGKNAALTKDALRRARKSKEMASMGSGDGEDGDGSGGGKRGGGMWDFVNRGVGGAAAATASRKSGGGSASASSIAGATGSSSAARSKVRGNGGGGSNLDDLLGDLDDSYPTTASSSSSTKRRTGGASKGGAARGGARRGVYGSSAASRGGGARGGATSRGGRASLGFGRARYQQQAEQQRPVESHQFGDDDDDDDAPMPFADDDDDEIVGGGSMDVEPSPVTSGTTVGEKRKVADDADGDEGDADASSPSSKKVSFEKSHNAKGDMEVDGVAKAATTASATKAPRRRQFAKAKVGSKMSAPLRAAMEAKRAQQAAVARVTQASASAQVKQEGAAKSTGAANNGGMSTTAPRSLDATSASFRPDVIEGESNQSDEMKAAAAANLESVIQTETDVAEGKDANRYLDFFWTDGKEHPSRKGTILLFGKVEVNAAQNAKSKASKNASSKQYVSCCVAVSGNSRNLFVLPRKKEGGSDGNEFESMMDVHTELKSVLQPACIPNREGASWGGKVVDRQYAFHDASVPRDATKYLKVVYDAQYPVPAEEVCMNGGRYFQKIFGAGASNLENFIVKRKRELCIRLICFGWYDQCDYWLIKLTHVILIISSSL